MSLREESSEQWSVTDRGEVNRLSDGTFWRLYCRVFSYLVSRYMSSPNFFFLFFFFKGRWGVRSDFSRGQLDMWGDAPLCPSALPSPSPLWILFTNASAGFSKRGLMGLLVTKKNALELQESQISQALVCAVLYKWWQMSFLDRQTHASNRSAIRSPGRHKGVFRPPGPMKDLVKSIQDCPRWRSLAHAGSSQVSHPRDQHWQATDFVVN